MPIRTRRPVVAVGRRVFGAVGQAALSRIEGDGDGAAELVELVDGPAGGAFGVALGEVGAAEVLVGDVAGGYVPDRGDDGVLDGDQGCERATAGGQTLVTGLRIGVLGFLPCRTPRGRGRLEVGIAGPDLGVLCVVGGHLAVHRDCPADRAPVRWFGKWWGAPAEVAVRWPAQPAFLGPGPATRLPVAGCGTGIRSGQRIRSEAQDSQGPSRCVGDPFPDRRQCSGTGQDAGGDRAQQGVERVDPPLAAAGIRHLVQLRGSTLAADGRRWPTSACPAVRMTGRPALLPPSCLTSPGAGYGLSPRRGRRCGAVGAAQVAAVGQRDHQVGGHSATGADEHVDPRVSRWWFVNPVAASAAPAGGCRAFHGTRRPAEAQ